MAAPTPSARVTPTGFKLEDGYQALITFSNDTSVQLWEKTVKPPGVDGGAKIPTSTMHNRKIRTFAPRHLYELTDGDVKCAYDPDVLVYILANINVPQTITYRYPDDTTECFFGALTKFEPDALEEGKMPEASVVIIATNEDWAHGYVEQEPVITPASGT